MCLIGFPRCGFSHSTVQILWSLDEMLVNEALHQGLKMYSSWPTFLKFYFDSEFFGGQLQRATSLSVCINVLCLSFSKYYGLMFKNFCYPTRSVNCFVRDQFCLASGIGIYSLIWHVLNF
ncbi:hypothetical protein ACQJBY_035921 [Aegilops geniculata]